jgi:exodeoxyribonuclease-3
MAGRIATQNINWGGEPQAPGCDGAPRLDRLVSSVGALDADVVVLTEFKSGPLGDELATLLGQAGYPHLHKSDPPPYRLGTAIAARRPLVPATLPIPLAQFGPVEPWRSIGVHVDGIEVFGCYFPLGEAKPLFWNWLLDNARALWDRDVLLVGDFNTGHKYVDEAGDTFACQEQHAALEALGFVDTWRAAHPTGRDYTWYSSAGNGFRLDYVWASASLAGRVSRVWHDHEPRLKLASDHSAVVAELR